MTIKKVLLVAAAAGLSGCVSLLPDSGELPPRLRLEASAPIDSVAAPVDVALVINDPSAERVFNTFNVALVTGPYKSEYVDGAEWADRVPVMFRLYLERRFENARAVTAVGDQTELAVNSDYVLYTDIRAFHIDRSSGAERARVAYGARLADSRGNTLASKVFSRDAETGGQTPDAYAAAINRAAEDATAETVTWAVGILRNAEARKAEPSASVEVTGG